MVALSANVGSDQKATLQNLKATERQANREAIAFYVTAIIEDGTLPPAVGPAGLAAMFKEFLLGISLVARGGVTGAPHIAPRRWRVSRSKCDRSVEKQRSQVLE